MCRGVGRGSFRGVGRRASPPAGGPRGRRPAGGAARRGRPRARRVVIAVAVAVAVAVADAVLDAALVVAFLSPKPAAGFFFGVTRILNHGEQFIMEKLKFLKMSRWIFIYFFKFMLTQYLNAYDTSDVISYHGFKEGGRVPLNICFPRVSL
ncbi:Protein of unknown function [Gryllus bimaculatus]|nr:Protein of unknown function [Gryllus bimaculatus]